MKSDIQIAQEASMIHIKDVAAYGFHPENVGRPCIAITPVPGGVGLMTIAMLMYHCVWTVTK